MLYLLKNCVKIVWNSYIIISKIYIGVTDNDKSMILIYDNINC